ncbi:hypothetical protein AJ80_07862 [Polytolypa hystricis UAMH7299]|uniref:MalT-like TPR region domain-containing protein n=1 Tax=Polytolypa hystricis (strain UAMH7299) TaxID=1447883 RepID=A0A2B7XI67_POLH7|nr:hypothetical protein AJ80_07862 [Polytolypa hystricis UAMH7299]
MPPAPVEHFRQEIQCLDEAVHGKQITSHHLRIAMAYEHMAVGTQQLGKYEEAFTWHGKNLEILLNHHPDAANDISVTYLLELVLGNAQSALEKNSKDFQTCRARNFALRVLGNVRLTQERWDDAFTLHKRAFEYQVRTWGETHFETGVLCHRMGCYYERLGEIDIAINYFRAALSIFESTPVSMESHLVRTRYKLGADLTSLGNVDEGKRLLRLAKEGRETLRGTPPHVDDSITFYDALVPYCAW